MFLLDANVLIEASRTYYSVRIAPTYWAWLADQHLAGNIASVASVRKERAMIRTCGWRSAR